MKRTLLTIAVAATVCGSALAQNTDLKKAVDGFKAKIESSDKEVNDDAESWPTPEEIFDDWGYNEDEGYDPYLGCYTDDC